MQLDPVDVGSTVSSSFHLSDTPAWQRIRAKWGEPKVALFAMVGQSLLCWTEVPMQFKVTGARARVATLPHDLAPYLKTAPCNRWGILIAAHSQYAIRIDVTKTATTTRTLRLVGQPYWDRLSTKDQIVGVQLEATLHRLAQASAYIAAIAGLVLVVFGIRSLLGVDDSRRFS